MAGHVNFPAQGDDGQKVNKYENTVGGIARTVVLKPHKKTENCNHCPVGVAVQPVSFLPFIRWQDADTDQDVANGDQNNKKNTYKPGVRE